MRKIIVLSLLGLFCTQTEAKLPSCHWADPDSANSTLERKLGQRTHEIFVGRYKWHFHGGENLALYDFIADWHGTPYWYGGCTKRGTDCAGFVQALYRGVFGKEIPRDGHSQAMVCEPVAKEELQEGDMVFFSYNSRYIGHVGVYLGEGRFAHSASRVGVIVSHLDEAFWKRYFKTGGRLKTGA